MHVLFNFVIDSYDSTKYMCQVFYHKEGTNHWTVTVAFLSIEQTYKQRLVSEYRFIISAFDTIINRVSQHSIKMLLLAQFQISSSRRDPMLQSKLALTKRQQQDGT